MKRLISAVLTLLLTLSLCPAALAEGDTVYISGADDLFALAERCSYDAWSRGKTVILTRDVNLGGMEFAPIPSFGGTFDGTGHKISGLSVTGAASPAGLFGVVAESGTVRDLTVEGTVAPAQADRSGGVAGLNRGQLVDCVFTGTVVGGKRSGGIAGENAVTGIIRDCAAEGGVTGRSMTGGIVGANHGSVLSCVNRAYVNTAAADPTLDVDRLDLSLVSGIDGLVSADALNIIADSGGIAGWSDALLSGCHNYGTVGYQHVGYNVGGVAGRSSGHISACINEGAVSGRREVGGIVGAAEPEITLNLRENSLEQARDQLYALRDAVDRALSDAQNTSDTLSARLTAMSGAVDDTTDRTEALTGQLRDYWNGTVAEINRGSDIVDAVIPMLSETTDELERAADAFTDASEIAGDALRKLENVADGDVKTAVRELRSAMDEIHRDVNNVKSALDDLENLPTFDVAATRAAIAALRSAVSALAGSDGTASPFRRLSDAADALTKAVEKAGNTEIVDALDRLADAGGMLSAALRSLGKTLDYLDRQEQLTIDTLGEETDAAADALYDSLRGISAQVELLNQESKRSSDILIADARQIERLFTALTDTLIGAAEDAENASASDFIEDVSDEEMEKIVNGKVLLCVNRGSVSGDIDVGGVAGSMMVYNELDPENDADGSFVYRRYELKCVLQDCVNRGAVSGKRDNVGAVCGMEALGVISGCEAYGSARSDGDCVGGIAGFADGAVRRCWAKCALSGGKYVGGIVGSGRDERSRLTVEDCRALVEIAGDGAYHGSILGGESGTVRGNLFVSDTLAGVNRVSEAGKAAPVPYETLLSEPALPADFRRFTLRFVAEDETVAEQTFSYGDSLSESVFPAIPARSGQYARWDRETLDDLRFDTTVTAVYEPYVTALDCESSRSAGRSVFFVKGAFTDGDALGASPAVLDFSPGADSLLGRLRSYRKTLLEQWHLSIPDDGLDVHTVRYLPPEGVSDRLELYCLTSSGWSRMDTERAGSYLCFDAVGGEVDLTVVSAATPWWVWALVALLLAAVAALVLVWPARKKKAPVPAAHDAQNVPTSEPSEEEKALLARRTARHRKLRRVLLAAAAALALAVGGVMLLAPGLTDSMALYTLLRNYAEGAGHDMELRVSGTLNDRVFEGRADLYTTNVDDKRVGCMLWRDIPLYYCDGVMLLENGSAYRADDTLPDYSELLSHAAALYRMSDVTKEASNGVVTYRAVARGELAGQLLAPLVPDAAALAGDTEAVTLELVVTDGEPTDLRVHWDGLDGNVDAGIRLSAAEKQHTLPQDVTLAIRSGEYAEAAEIGDELRELLLAWVRLSVRDPLTAAAELSAGAGPLVVKDSLTWQRAERNGTDLCVLTRQGSRLYYTAEAACTDTGAAANRASLDTVPNLLKLAYLACVQGTAQSEITAAGTQYTLALDADAMADFAAEIAPEARNLALAFDSGTLRLDLEDGDITALTIQSRGSVRVAQEDVSASFTAALRFAREAAFTEPSPAVLRALGLTQ